MADDIAVFRALISAMGSPVKATAAKAEKSGKSVKPKKPYGSHTHSDPSAKSKPLNAAVGKSQKAASQVVRDRPRSSHEESAGEGTSDGRRKPGKKPPRAGVQEQEVVRGTLHSSKEASAREGLSQGKRKADKKRPRARSGDEREVVRVRPPASKEARAGPNDGRHKTSKKPVRARSKGGEEQELMSPSAKKRRKRSPASRKGRAHVKDGKTIPLSSAQTAKWKVLSKEGLDYLTAAIDGTVLSLLREKLPEKDATQKHLNNLKSRLLARCRDLSVPPEIPGQYKNIHSKLELEAQQLEYNQKIVEHLQEEIEKTVEELEQMGEELESLQEKIRFLKSEQDDEEEDHSRQMQAGGSAGDSNFLELPKSGLDAPLLKEEVLRIQNHEALLLELHTARSSSATRDMQVLVERAYAEVDSL